MRLSTVMLLAILGISSASRDGATGYTRLFDGRSLQGWEGSHTVFKVIDGAIVGGTLERPIPQRDYLCTTREFADFELRVTAKVEGDPNAGVHFRSRRVPGTSEVSGYQADIGYISGAIVQMLSDAKDIDGSKDYPLWGSLLDEFRSEPGRYPDPKNPYWLLAVADRNVVEKALSRDGWNRLVVTAQGPRITIRLNDVPTVEFLEKADLVQKGLVCLQVHNGGPSRAWYKDISIRELAKH
jgi:hypothetical protein